MTKPRIYADFNNADPQGRLRLSCAGTRDDLARQRIELREGLALTFCTDDLNDNGEPDQLEVDGVVTFSQAEDRWVAIIDWSAIHYASAGAEPAARSDEGRQ